MNATVYHSPQLQLVLKYFNNEDGLTSSRKDTGYFVRY